MALKVYGHPWSINTRKTLATLAEKGHKAELVVVMLPKGEQRSPRHLARHPFGKVPVLEDDGFFLYESAAIDRYLDRKLPGARLVPEDAREAALADQWLGVLDAYFHPHVQPLGPLACRGDAHRSRLPCRRPDGAYPRGKCLLAGGLGCGKRTRPAPVDKRAASQLDAQAPRRTYRR